MVSQYAQKPLESVKREERVKKCPDCGNTEIMYENGERYCKKCGLVID